MANFGEAWVQIRIDKSKLDSDIRKSQAQITKAVTGIENNIRATSKTSTANKGLSTSYDKLTKSMRSAQVTNDGFRKGLVNTRGEVKSAHKSFGELTLGILKSAPAFAVATAGIAGVYGALRIFQETIVGGLKAVEDYNIKVATMSAFLTTFADKTQEGGDVGKIYQRADKEARVLINTLEKLDRQTIASGKDLTTMAEQFIKSGISVRLNTKETQQGFVAIANATKLLTAGQNQEIQQRQEIRALLNGELKQSNLLIMALKAKDPLIKENLKLWKEQGTTIAEIGKLLDGFIPAAKSLEQTWAVIGSSMKTISDIVLRGAMLPAYQELINLATKLSDGIIDDNNQLSAFAIKLQNDVKAIAGDIVIVIKALAAATVFLIENLDAVRRVFLELVAIATVGIGVKAVTAIFSLNTAFISTSVSVALATKAVTKLQLAILGLGIGFIGFEIGTYFNKFEAFRKTMAFLFVDIVQGWDLVAFSFKVVVTTIEVVWDKLINKLTKKYGEFILGVSKLVGELPFDIGKETAAELRASGKSLTDTKSPEKALGVEIDKLTKAYVALGKTRQKVLAQMLEPISLPTSAAKGTEISDYLDLIAPKDTSAEDKAIQKRKENQKKALENLAKQRKEYAKLTDKTAQDSLNKRKAAEDKYYDFLGLSSEKSYLHKKRLILHETDVLIFELGETKSAVDKGNKYKLKKIEELDKARKDSIKEQREVERDAEIERLRDTGNFVDAIKAANMEILASNTTTAEKIGDGWKELYAKVTEGIGDFINPLKESFLDVSTLWESMLDSMVTAFADTMVKIAAEAATEKLVAAAGGIFDIGASFLSGLKIFHDGTLKADEGLAILQNGEMVIPAEQSQVIRDSLSGSFNSPSQAYDAMANGVSGMKSDIGYDALGRFGSSLAARTAGVTIAGSQIGASSDQIVGAALDPRAMKSMGLKALSDSVLSKIGAGGVTTTDPSTGDYITEGFGAIGQWLGGPVGYFVGKVLGEGVADYKDARDWEKEKDAIEDGYLTGAVGIYENFKGYINGKVAQASFGRQMNKYTGGDYGGGDYGGGDYGGGMFSGGGSNLGASLSGGTSATEGPSGDPSGSMKAKYGGVFSGPMSGFPMEMHGTEAVVPLPNGKSIPVEMSGSGNDKPLNITIMIGNEQFDSRIEKIADDVRVEATRRDLGIDPLRP